MVEEDPLYRPLGAPRAGAERPPRRGLWGTLSVLALVGAAAAAVLVRHADRQAPAEVAVVPIEAAPKPPATPTVPPPASVVAASPPGPPPSGDVEIQHGVKIIRLTPAASSASVALSVPDRRGTALAPAPDARVTETTPFGPLPRVGPDGARPAAVYARPTAATGGPRVALVVAGLGRNQVRTAEAAQRLPPAVTFAFPPDGPDLATQVAEARSAGHEVILQLPALADGGAPSPAEASAPIDGLRRLMARFSGYAGVSLPDGFGPTLRDAAVRELLQRGLYVLDTAPPTPPGVPEARSGLRAADAAMAPGVTSQDLDRLAARARATGSAVGWIAGPGADPEVIARFAASLAGQHGELVPLSAIADGAAERPQVSK